jgi:hypothetical protein
MTKDDLIVLHDELVNDPNGLGYKPLLDAGNDSGLADMLNTVPVAKAPPPSGLSRAEELFGAGTRIEHKDVGESMWPDRSGFTANGYLDGMSDEWHTDRGLTPPPPDARVAHKANP